MLIVMNNTNNDVTEKKPVTVTPPPRDNTVGSLINIALAVCSVVAIGDYFKSLDKTNGPD